MTAQLPMFGQLTLPGMSNATSSLASAAGATPSISPGGPKTSRSGPGAAPASRSQWQDAELARLTSDTSGPLFATSSPSAALQSSLESRLRQRLAAYGSPEYALTWKSWDMPLGPPICALRASGRRTSASGSTGWPSPRTPTGGPESAERKQELGRTRSGGGDLASVALLAGWVTPSANEDAAGNYGTKMQVMLGSQVRLLAGWGTPTVQDAKHSTLSPSEAKRDPNVLRNQVQLAGWATPSSRDWKDTPGMATTGMNPDGSTRTRLDQLPRQALLASESGPIPTSSTVATGGKGGFLLNPRFSLWLQGFPTEWASCGERVTRSSRRSRRSS